MLLRGDVLRPHGYAHRPPSDTYSGTQPVVDADDAGMDRKTIERSNENEYDVSTIDY